MKSEYYIHGKGMGSFLLPPGHPSYKYCVQSGLASNPDESSSLEWVASDPDKSNRYGSKLVKRVQEMLDEYYLNKPALNSPEVVDWTRQVLGYYRNCYRNPGLNDSDGAWDVSKLLIEKRNPLEGNNIQLHAGVRLIRQYYPEFSPTAVDFDNSYWGEKEQAANIYVPGKK